MEIRNENMEIRNGKMEIRSGNMDIRNVYLLFIIKSICYFSYAAY